MKKNIVLLDLFSGIGGFALGLTLSGFQIQNHYYSEIDPYAMAVYDHQFKEAVALGSVTDIRKNEIKKPNIITFGSPCQDFSIAGRGKGLKGNRSKLLTEAVRIIQLYQPDIFIWENIKGAYSSNQGRDFQAILRAFTNIGSYRLEWQLLNTSWFLPQNRERIYLIGHLDKKSCPRVFPFQESDSVFSKKKSQEPSKKRLRSESLVSTIDSRYGAIRNGGETYLLVNSGNKCGFEMVENGDLVDLSFPSSKTRKSRVNKSQVAHTVDTRCRQGVCQHGRLRHFTELECERLQGFPDEWTKYGKFDGEIKEISKTQRYRQIGNAVSVDVMKAIGTRLIN